MKAFSDRSSSPCVGVCQMHPHTGLCVGCLRSSAEIIDWCVRSEDERLAILRRLEARRAAQNVQKVPGTF